MDLSGLTTDKIGHGYVAAYENIADSLSLLFRTNGIRMAEIGVASGEGLKFFRRLFPHGFIVGVDERVTAAALATGENVIERRQEAPMLKHDLAEIAGGQRFHLIVDDASHDYRYTSATLEMLWPMVEPGGYYVIEDWTHGTGLERLAHDLVEMFLGLPRPVVGKDGHHVRLTPVPGVMLLNGLIIMSEQIV